MKMKKPSKKMTVVGMAILLILSSIPSNSFAGSRKAVIMVSATVMEKVTQTIVRQVGSLSVTQENIKKGYVDVPSATVLQVQTNNPEGYLLSFEVNEEMAKEVWVMDNGRTTVISGGVGFVQQPYPGSAGEVKEIGYRIFLASGMEPGLYPWPLSVSTSLQ
jgi:hypothetical protein